MINIFYVLQQRSAKHHLLLLLFAPFALALGLGFAFDLGFALDFLTFFGISFTFLDYLTVVAFLICLDLCSFLTSTFLGLSTGVGFLGLDLDLLSLRASLLASLLLIFSFFKLSALFLLLYTSSAFLFARSYLFFLLISYLYLLRASFASLRILLRSS